MGTIIRVAHGHAPYTVIDRRVLEDERLSWAARGILGYLLAKPDDWQLRIGDLRRRGDLGRDALYRVLKQLRAHGYVERRVLRDPRGRIAEIDYLVHEVPSAACPLPENPDTGEPDPDGPDTAQPDPDEPDPAEPTLLSNHYTKEPDHQVTTTTKPAAAEAAPSGGGERIFPKAFSSRERDQADAMLRDVGEALGQALLDELAGRLEQGALRGAPLAYLRGLVRRAEAGTFTPEAGLGIAEARARRERAEAATRRAASAPPALPPVDPDHPLARRVAQIRARASGPAPAESPEGGDR